MDGVTRINSLHPRQTFWWAEHGHLVFAACPISLSYQHEAFQHRPTDHQTFYQLWLDEHHAGERRERKRREGRERRERKGKKEGEKGVMDG